MLADVLASREAAQVAEIVVEAVSVVVVNDVASRNRPVRLLPHQGGAGYPPVRLRDLDPRSHVAALWAVAKTHRPDGGPVVGDRSRLELRTRRTADPLRGWVKLAALEGGVPRAFVGAPASAGSLRSLAVEGSPADFAVQGDTLARTRRLPQRSHRWVGVLARIGAENESRLRLAQSIRADAHWRATGAARNIDHASNRSGTTLRMALGNGRSAIGIDLDQRNADLAMERVGMFLSVECEEVTA